MTLSTNLKKFELAASRAGATPRETEILVLIIRGLTNADIAQRLALSHNTVKSHIRSAYQRLGVTSRAEFSSWAIQIIRD